jgi:SAM-dependent methyltransferase
MPENLHPSVVSWLERECVLAAPFRRLLAQAIIRTTDKLPDAPKPDEVLAACEKELQRLEEQALRSDISPVTFTMAKGDIWLLLTWWRTHLTDPDGRRAIIPFGRRLVTAGVREYVDDPPFRFSSTWFDMHVEAWSADFDHLRGKPGLRALEVGCFEGRATRWLLANLLTHEASKITCVDFFKVYEEQEETFAHNIRSTGLEHKVERLNGDSFKILPTLKPHFDFIYIDADHNALPVMQDALLAWRLLRVGGHLVFDDYELGRKFFDDDLVGHPALILTMPKHGIDAFMYLMRGQFEVVRKEYQVVLRKSRG